MALSVSARSGGGVSSAGAVCGGASARMGESRRVGATRDADASGARADSNGRWASRCVAITRASKKFMSGG
eukprot:524413-Pleurochrysis_carterae.AAC.1